MAFADRRGFDGGSHNCSARAYATGKNSGLWLSTPTNQAAVLAQASSNEAKPNLGPTQAD